MMVGEQKKPRQRTEEIKADLLHIKDVLKILECPVCLRISEPDALIQCRNGHFGCKPCFTRLIFCPICRIILGPEIQTFCEETLKIVHQELRHLERDLLTPEGVFNLFKCVRCKFTPTVLPVSQCLKGHLFCNTCTIGSRWCNSCFLKSNSKKVTLQFTIRNLAVQSLLSLISIPCRFTRHGCSAKIKGFIQHEANCSFSEIDCVLPLCWDRVSLPKLLAHIVEDCTEKIDFLQTADLNKILSIGFGRVTVPQIPREKYLSEGPIYARGNLLKLGKDNYFLFVCHPKPAASLMSFYTYFIGVPEVAKKYHYILKLKFQKDSPLVEKRGPVISACTNKFLIYLHPDAIQIKFSEIREALQISTTDLNFAFEVEVFEGNHEELGETNK